MKTLAVLSALIVQVLACAAVVAGIALIYVPAAFIAGGILTVAAVEQVRKALRL